ncbi:MAG: ATP-binding protein [Elusimicrobiota bacterium]|nr:ATP-binding protein [Elusimicrobiota bacterium]
MEKTANISAQGMVRDLVSQFSDTLAFYRELIQNAIDAGSNRIDVSLEYVPGPKGEKGLAVLRVEDDGSGMDEDILDNYLLVLFKSSKENDLTKIGKFGVGFLSVFALKPELVRVYTAKNMESWRLDFPDYRSYQKYRMPDPRDGTLVEIHKRMSPQEYAALSEKSLATVRYWCRHADTRIVFTDRSLGSPELQLNEPFSLPGGESLRYSEEGTEVAMAFSAPEAVQLPGGLSYSGEDKPFYGFYNRGLTLKEGRKVFIPGVEFKIKSRYLEHTITRDNVMEDENYAKAMAIIKRLASKELPKKLRPELEAVALRLSKASALKQTAEVRTLEYEWERRKTFLKFLAGGFLADFRYDFEEWKILPAVTGVPVSIEDLKAAWKKLVRLGGLYENSPSYFAAAAPDAVTHALCALGAPVLLKTETCGFADFISWAGESMTSMEVSALVIAEETDAGKLAPGLASFLKTLPLLGEVCGRNYSCVYPARLSYGHNSAAQQPFIFRKAPYGVGRRDEGYRLKGGRFCPVINCSHPFIENLAGLHASRPGFASFLLLKSMLLQQEGGVHPDAEGASNLGEKLEKKLLEAAVKLDAAGGRNG